MIRLEGLLASDKARNAARWLSFAAVTVAVWVSYCTWRPPAPILRLRHIEHLDPVSANVSLTFDDAPHPMTTPLLLAALQRTGV
ncbi:MAG: hypothetical protein JOZ57_17385, partial [Abitibacteriaceae bacterium]|nr:hypothetical protein [Abditibacteriaceae bacterium]